MPSRKRAAKKNSASKTETVDDSILGLLYSPVCTHCRHWSVATDTCSAFDKIPGEIWEGRNYHIAPYPGDKGVQFDFVPDTVPEVKADWLRRSRISGSNKPDLSGRGNPL